METISPENLKRAREDAGIKRVLVAIALEVHDTTLWRWERGRGKWPKKHVLKAWHGVLMAMIDDLTAVGEAAKAPPLTNELPKVQEGRNPAKPPDSSRLPNPVAGGTSSWCGNRGSICQFHHPCEAHRKAMK